MASKPLMKMNARLSLLLAGLLLALLLAAGGPSRWNTLRALRVNA